MIAARDDLLARTTAPARSPRLVLNRDVLDSLWIAAALRMPGDRDVVIIVHEPGTIASEPQHAHPEQPRRQSVGTCHGTAHRAPGEFVGPAMDLDVATAGGDAWPSHKGQPVAPARDDGQCVARAGMDVDLESAGIVGQVVGQTSEQVFAMMGRPRVW